MEDQPNEGMEQMPEAQIPPVAIPREKDRFLPISILIAAVVLGGAIVFATLYKSPASSGAAPDGGAPPSAPVPAAAMKLGPRDVVLGNANAPVTLIEYGDYQCPFCARFFSETQSQIVANYVKTGKVKMVFRNFVVNDRSANDHESHNAALAAECAKDQNKFWDFHDAVYALEVKDEAANPTGAENNGNLTRAAFIGAAKSVGMDTAAFTTCYDSGKYKAAVQAESDQAGSYGVDATPTFFVNGQSVVGAQPYPIFEQVFAGLLK